LNAKKRPPGPQYKSYYRCHWCGHWTLYRHTECQVTGSRTVEFETRYGRARETWGGGKVRKYFDYSDGDHFGEERDDADSYFEEIERWKRSLS